jgi:hypothetical protein
LNDLRDRINEGLISASDQAHKAIEKLKETEGHLSEAAGKKEELRKKF